MDAEQKLLPEEDKDDDTLEWQEMLNGIGATNVPMHMLKYIKAYMTNNKTFLFPVQDWIEQGNDIETIEETINFWFEVNRKKVERSSFVVNLAKLKEEITKETKRTLKNLG